MSTTIKITSGDTILTEGTRDTPAPIITNSGYPILRLELGCGTNCLNVQYFNVTTKESSEVFFVPSIYADYTDDDGNALIAYFDYADESAEDTVLVVRSIFDGEIISKINREFISPLNPANTLIFLNENNIYVAYDRIIGATRSEYYNDGNGFLWEMQETVSFNRNTTSDSVYTDYDDFYFSYLFDKIFCFSSGVGAWRTTVHINTDGTFNGYYLDSDAGFQTVCVFSGNFTSLIKTGDYEYSMICETLNIHNKVGTRTVLNGIPTTYANPYGFDDAYEFKLYLPGKNLDELPLEYKQWVYLPWENPENDEHYSNPDYGNVLTAFGLYNEGGKQGYIVR